MLAFGNVTDSDIARVNEFRKRYGSKNHRIFSVSEIACDGDELHITGDFSSKRFWNCQPCRGMTLILDYFWFANGYWEPRYGGDLKNSKRSWFGPNGKADYFFQNGGCEILFPVDINGEVEQEIHHYNNPNLAVTVLEPEDNDLIRMTNEMSPTYHRHMNYLRNGRYFSIKKKSL